MRSQHLISAMTIIVVAIIGFFLVSPLLPSPDYRLPGEVINTTKTIAYEEEIGLPGPGTYCVNVGTTSRDSSPAQVGYYYSWTEVIPISDKFGSYYNNKTHFGGGDRVLGQADANTDVDRIFTTPKNAETASVMITNGVDRSRGGWNPTSTSVRVAIKPCVAPPAPVPPAPGTIVNCSDYLKTGDVQTWYSSDGSQGLDVPGSPDPRTFHGDHILVITDKVGGHSLPVNLTTIEGNKCQVVP